MLKRRKFVKNMAAIPAVALGSGVFWLPRTADAIIPGIVARFLLGGLMRKGAQRAVASVATRRIATSTAGNVSRQIATRSATASTASTSVSGLSVKGVALSALSVSGISVSFSPKIYAMSKEYGSDIVWVRDGHSNMFQYDVENPSDKAHKGSLDIFLKDADTNRIIDQIPMGIVEVNPRKAFNYSFELERFDFEGVIRLFSESSSPELVSPPSGNIIVANADEIFISEN